MRTSTESNKLKEILSKGPEPHLMTGSQYKESLRDGRRIIDAEGNEVEDVTTHPAFKNSVEHLAKLYDYQFDPETRDKTTYIDPKDGKRYSLGWEVPKTKEDLKRRRELLRLSTYHTLGVFGRPNDYGSMKSIGFLLINDKMREENPEMADNIVKFIEFSRKHNIMSTDLVPDVQSDRSVPANQRPGRLRIVEETPDGVVLYGAKPVGSVAAQAHFVTISTGLSPDLGPNEALWIAVPVNSKGLTMVLREPVTNPDSTFEDHPIDSFGEEMDNMLIFDHVFVPREYLFSIKNVKLLSIYGETGVLAHWHILSRLMYRAEIFSGVAQTIVDILGTNSFQGVREDVSEVVSYAATLKAFILAAEEEAVVKNGVFIPSEELITAGRLHSIVHYPKIMHILRDLCGQGLVSRFTAKAWEHPDVGPKFDEFLSGTGVSAREKNRFFNFVWDLTSSSHASRVALFENVNSTNAPVVKFNLYRLYDRSAPVNFVRKHLDLPSIK
ncbi:4-hydroxyphenylacetate 3-monooxygenase [Peribacillus cavernae]|uniref:4-hydroxyphenylacetate 3-monooxygenase n=1 Tax=Peribacillus cavernae TaxID=1674310 RepID=A0A433HEB1_9BACI|nr:4-hydroxyphenylacetate 3-hydroxylase N-terminal domain-containing protein [Peribacillus cavernae]MDQ0219855.1 aromatic ring hydroxylase [Peribacillus cavernae]RUQ26652.1 4-hydroxyphenylacetate 3-monooxygenase [Peribacillus cavernae]